MIYLPFTDKKKRRNILTNKQSEGIMCKVKVDNHFTNKKWNKK